MSQFNRFLWTGLVLGLAACGDDVTVTNPPEPEPVVPGVTAVSVAPDGASINVNGTLGMTAAATLEPGAAAPTWAWSSSNTAIATVAGTTANATVTGVAAGSAGIRATATSGTSSASGVATVFVTAAATCSITGVSISPVSAELVVGQTLAVAGNVTGTNCTAAQLTPTYESSDAAIATVNATSGLVTALKAGSVTITAKTSDPSKKAAMSISILNASPATVSIKSITQYATNVPVDLTNVAGQVEVTLNIDPGSAPRVTKIQALINGIVMAEQLPAAGSIAASSPEAAAAEVVLSTNTRQVWLGQTGTLAIPVPVIFNGPAQVTARIFVEGSTTPAVSNAIPVVMQNQDAFLWAENSWELSATGTTGVTNPANGPTWFQGDLELADGFYVSFFPVTPEITAESNLCDESGDLVGGTPQTGIILEGTFDCAGVEGAATIDELNIVPGDAPAADVIFIEPDSDPETTGSPYKVDGTNRWNLLSYDWPSQEVYIDNVGPTLAVDVAYNVNFDQDWISTPFTWSSSISGTDAGSGYVASTEKAFLYDGALTSGTSPVPTCTTSSQLLADAHGLAQTLTDKGADAYQICGQAADALGNTTRKLSNKFGVDTESPTAALALSRGIDPVGAYVAPSVSATANTSKYGTLASVINQPWGLEAQDGRSGFNQIDANTGAGVNYYTAIQKLNRVWPGATVDAGNSACTLSDQLNTTLSDGWKRSTLPANPADALDCGQGVGYYWYSGYVVDRAGNVSKPVGATTAGPIVRNFVYDLAAPNMTGIGFQSTAYTPGAAGAFGFSANDDLNIVEGQVGMNYTGLPAPAVGVLFPYNTGAVVLGPGFGIMWPTLKSQLANVLNGTTASAPVIFRVDETCAFNANPYANCDVGTYGAGSRPTGALSSGLPIEASDAYNNNLSIGGQLTNAQKMPNAVYANVRDVLSRESATGAAGLFLNTQFNPATGIRSPWGYSNVAVSTYGLDIANWTAAVVSGNVVATHRTVTSNGLTVFQSVHLFRLNTVTNALTHCGVMTNPTAPTIDNGSYRTWTYTVAVPTLANPCHAGNGVTGPWKVLGLYNGAALATPAF